MALGVERYGARGIREVVEGRLVELVVVGLLDLRGALLPDGGHGVDGLQLLVLDVARGVLGQLVGILDRDALGDHHPDGMAHVVGVAPDEVAQGPLGEEPVGVLVLGGLAQVEDDVGAVVVCAGALPRRGGPDGVALDAVRLPRIGGVRPKGAAHHAHARGHHERRVEAHAKLANDVCGVALAAGMLGLELLRSRVRDGAQVLLELRLAHADAVVRDRHGAGILVEGHEDGQVVLADAHRAVREGGERELVDGVGGVGHQLAQEDLPVGVDRVDHEVEELLALGLELLHETSLPFGIGCGTRPPIQTRSLVPQREGMVSEGGKSPRALLREMGRQAGGHRWDPGASRACPPAPRRLPAVRPRRPAAQRPPSAPEGRVRRRPPPLAGRPTAAPRGTGPRTRR